MKLSQEDLIQQLEYSKLHFNDKQLTVILNQAIEILKRIDVEKIDNYFDNLYPYQSS